MMSFKPRSALQVLAPLAAAFFLATAVARVVVVPTPASVSEVPQAGFGVLHAEMRACMANTHRSHEECLDEIEGKDLVQRAEQMAQLEERQGSAIESDVAARPPRSSAP